MTDLSPAAQSVFDAAGRKTWYRNNDIAAALRAAADQFNSVEAMPGAPFCRNRLLTIANELENIDE